MKIIFSKLLTSRIQAATIRIALHIGHRFDSSVQNIDERCIFDLFSLKISLSQCEIKHKFIIPVVLLSMNIIFSKLLTSRIQAATIRIALHIGHRFDNSVQNIDERCIFDLFFFKNFSYLSV
jgi:hypothetical protein